MKYKLLLIIKINSFHLYGTPVPSHMGVGGDQDFPSLSAPSPSSFWPR